MRTTIKEQIRDKFVWAMCQDNLSREDMLDMLQEDILDIIEKGDKMKGWVLCENEEPVSPIFLMIFKTKEALFEYYSGSLGDQNSIKRVEYAIGIKPRKR